jgi:hypothetical protein
VTVRRGLRVRPRENRRRPGRPLPEAARAAAYARLCDLSDRAAVAVDPVERTDLDTSVSDARIAYLAACGYRLDELDRNGMYVGAPS